jgi:hypothetical protein
MKVISLTQGMVTVVDDEDYDIVSQFSFHASKRKNGYYAVSNFGTRKKIYLHRFLMNAKSGEIVDHRNRNTLDNQKSNLRIVTPAQSNQNKTIQSHSLSGAKGVTLSTRKDIKNKWIAQISTNRKRINLGYFPTRDLAAEAYDAAAKKYFGEFSCTNAMLSK